MPNLLVEVNVTLDDVPVRGFPLTRRVTLDEVQAALPYEKVTGGGFVDLPTIAELATKQFILFQGDKALSLRFGSGAAGDLVLGANAIVLVVDMNHTADLEVDNSSGTTAKIKVIVGGT